ncbi:hypothetical protein BGX29_003000 [Mortierella sp. GBA35]|nr:hypothetical protein BGX29_003000 [Mortierella sp. GBA35]
MESTLQHVRTLKGDLAIQLQNKQDSSSKMRMSVLDIVEYLLLMISWGRESSVILLPKTIKKHMHLLEEALGSISTLDSREVDVLVHASEGGEERRFK